MNIARLGLLILALIGVPADAFACSCAPPGSVRQSVQRADAVFTARVLQVQSDGPSGPVRVSLSVARAWKGVERRSATVWTESNSAACGYPFTPGETYLIYAIRDDDRARSGRGELWVSVCSRTTAVGSAAEDLARLGPGWTPSPLGEPRTDTSPLLWVGSVLLLLLVGFFAGIYISRRFGRHG